MRYTDNQRSSQAQRGPGVCARGRRSGFNSVAVIQTARQTLRPFTVHFLPLKPKSSRNTDELS